MQILKALFIILLLPCSAYAEGLIIGWPSSSQTFIVNENFEGTGIPADGGGLDWTGSGTPDYDYTTVALEGTQSGLFNAHGDELSVTFSGMPEIYFVAKVYFSAVASSGDRLIELRDSSARVVEIGTHNSGRLYAKVNGSAAVYSGASVYAATDTSYWIKVKFIVSTGVVTVYSSADGSTWTERVTQTSTGMENIVFVRLGGSYFITDTVVDQWRVSATDINL